MRRRIAGRGRRTDRGSAPSEPRVVAIDGEVIRLGQFLKHAGLVGSGAEAKDAIALGLVDVDGEVDTRRGRQLTAGMVVTLRPDATGPGESVRVGTPGEEPDVPW